MLAGLMITAFRLVKSSVGAVSECIERVRGETAAEAAAAYDPDAAMRELIASGRPTAYNDAGDIVDAAALADARKNAWKGYALVLGVIVGVLLLPLAACAALLWLFS